MNKKWYPFILIAILLAALVVVKLVGKKSSTNTTKPKTTTTTKDPASTLNRDRGFDRRVSYLEYSEHAKCRMQCRKISQREVEEIMKEGKINYNKSDIQNARCPRYAVEGVTSDNQRVRIVYAQCDDKTVVVTVIDLEADYECHCPGDDDKYENKR